MLKILALVAAALVLSGCILVPVGHDNGKHGDRGSHEHRGDRDGHKDRDKDRHD